MRFLKTKILRAQEALLTRNNQESSSLSRTSENDIETLLEKAPSSYENPEKITAPSFNSNTANAQARRSHRNLFRASHLVNGGAMKNIVLNYGKAIGSFAVSHMAIPYLEESLEKFNITLAKFREFVNQQKAKIGGICSLRTLLLANKDDGEHVIACKKVFGQIAEVFIKYFSVNWIIHGRVTHKLTYLKFRYKMLRRIQNPECFTYIRERINNKRPVKKL